MVRENKRRLFSMGTYIDNQKVFFDKDENQYKPNLIKNPPLHTKLETQYLIERIGNVKSEYVLDFGAGSGRITIPLLKKEFSVCAVDISDKSLHRLKVLADQLKLSHLKISNRLPQDKKFAAILGADILHHIDLNEYLPVLYKSLKKGGKVVFSEPGAFNFSWYIYLPLFASWNVEKGVMNCSYNGLLRAFKKHGFKNIQITGFGFFPRPFFNWFKPLCILNDWLGNLPVLKLFAYRYIIEADKY